MTSKNLVVVDRLGNYMWDLPEVTVEEVLWDLDPALDQMTLSYEPGALAVGSIILNRLEIQLWVDNALLFWGVPRRRKGNSKRLSVTVEGLFTYFGYRFVLEEDLEFTNVDQMSVGAYMVGYAQSAIQGTNPGLNIGLGAYSLSGQLVTNTWLAERKQSIQSILGDFATLEGGFEQSIDIFGNGTRLWTPHYPERGSVKDDMYLEYGGNVVDFEFDENGQKQATKANATGGTQDDGSGGTEKINFIYEDTALSTEYGVHIAVLPAGNKTDLDWLERKATGAVNKRGRPTKVTKVFCRRGIASRDQWVSGPTWPDVLNGLWPGDYAPTRIDHPDVDVSGYQRVKTKHWQPEGDLTIFDFLDVSA